MFIECTTPIVSSPKESCYQVKPFHNGNCSGYHFQDGKPHLVCQYIMGHPFLVNVVCREGDVLYFDIYGGGEASKVLVTERLKQRFQDWIVQFSQAKGFDGLLSFDFIVEDISEEVYCVGCKPNLDLSIIKRHKPDEV